MVDPKPVQVGSKKELELEIAKIVKLFKEKESEDNWERRDKALMQVRGLIRGGVHEEYGEVFMQGFHQLLDGIVETIHSLRTSLVATVLGLINELSQALNTSIDPKVELLLQNLLKACASAKKLISQSATHTTNELLRNTSYHVRNLNSIHLAVMDKNGQLRTCAMSFIKTILEAHGQSRYDAITRSGGAEIIDKCLRKGVADATPAAREISRDVYVLFWELWQDRAQAILNSVDSSTKKQLIRHLGKLYTASTQGITVSNRASLRPASRAANNAGSNGNTKNRAASSLGKHVLTVTTSEDMPIPASPTRARPHTPSSKSMRSGRPGTPSSSIVSPPLSPRRPPSRMSASSSNESRSRSPVGPRRAQHGSRASVISPQPPLSPTGLSSSAARRLSVSPPPGRQVSATRSSSPGGNKRPMSPTAIGRRSQSVASHRTGLQAARRPGSSLGHRRLPLIDQLKHTDWRVKVEGLIEMTHMIQADGSSYEALVEAKALPVAQILAPVLLGLFTDANADVRAAASGSGRGGGGKMTPLKRLKHSLGDYFVAPALCRCLVSGGAAGMAAAKKSGSTAVMSAAGRRKVIAGVVAWMKEISERVIDENNGEIGYEAKCYFADMSNFKLYLTRLFPLLSTTSTTSHTYEDLADLINNLREVNHVLFEQVLYSFDAAVVADVEVVTGLDVARQLEEEEEGYYDDDPEIGMPTQARHGIEVGEEDGVYDDGEYDEYDADAMGVYDADHYDGVNEHDLHEFDNSMANLSLNQSSSHQLNNGNLNLQETASAGSTAKHRGMATSSHDMAVPLTPPKGRPITNGYGQDATGLLHRNDPLSVTSPLPAGASEKIDLLQRGLTQLHSGCADSLMFRKLIRLAKETSPEVDPLLTNSVWGINGEGFSALVTESITYLENEKDVAKKEYCILLVKQLLHCESTLLGVDANALLRQLMACRVDDSHSVCSAAEEALDVFVSLTNYQVCIDALIHLLEGCAAHVALSADEEHHTADANAINFRSLFGLKSNPLASGFMLFSKLLQRSESNILTSEIIAKVVGLATEGLNNHTPEVRKSAVDLIVALHSIQGDQLDVYLTNLSVPQRKLVAVYISRSQAVR
ncbi:clasp N terminal-domain-containing protein [Syncephalis fuscata]|nr:clasp N terminal-domain-containing protein [Syncephalis fuscata]